MPDADAAPPEEIETDSAAEEVEDAEPTLPSPSSESEDSDPLDVLDALDVIPDETAVVGRLDDLLIDAMEDVAEGELREMAERLGADSATPEAIARAGAQKLKTEENVQAIAGAADELLALPPPFEYADGPVLRFLAEQMLDYLAEKIVEEVS